LVKTWLADLLFPYANEFYSDIQQQLKVEALHRTDIFRPYRNANEQKNYLEWTADPSYRHYVSEHQNDFSSHPIINAPLNGLTVTQSGWLDLPLFLNASRSFFQELAFFREAHFSSADLALDGERATWQGHSFSKVINCMGAGAERDPLFNWLPFNPVKGQLLSCRIEGYTIQEIVNQGIFILPFGNNEVRVGATYSWHDLNWETTDDARQYLSEKLSPLLKVPFSIQKQLAGIRPSAKDRRPFIGRHPYHNSLYIFNGLGTKGVTLAPFFAKQLVDLFLLDQELNPEANITRYFSLYSKPRIS
jgi:glycine/D-amino acid oxidase-like deaminating enzyme